MTTSTAPSDTAAVAVRSWSRPPRWARPDATSWPTYLLAAALLLAAAVRLVHLNSVGLNSDEAVYAGQAASIDNDPATTPYFPVFRAHPLLFQALLSLVYRLGVHDLTGRLVEVVFGVATVLLTFLVGRTLFGPAAGAIAALLLAVMPYHVVVSRQILLDAPMTLSSTAALLFLARFDRSRLPRELVIGSGVLGLAVLTKETAVIFVAAVYIYLGLVAAARKAWVSAGIGLLLIIAMGALHPLLLAIVKTRTRGTSYLAWQLFRPPNHPFPFYLQTVPQAVGVLVLVCAAVALLHGHWSSREVLLVSWIAVPAVFFTVWPVKGFQYLLPVAPAVAILAARGLECGLSWPGGLPRALRGLDGLRRRLGRTGLLALRILAVVVVVLSLLVPTLGRVTGRSAATLAGSGGIPGGRETGAWIARNVPEGARIITIGPSMANVIQFYGDRACRALSVSTNPLHRNPVYEPILNADLALRTSQFQYVVWDAYSAGRSQHFSDLALALAHKYHGRVAHVETLRGGSGAPVIIVYQVHP